MDFYPFQFPKTCQPECDCLCHMKDGPACIECGGPNEAKEATSAPIE